MAARELFQKPIAGIVSGTGMTSAWIPQSDDESDLAHGENINHTEVESKTADPVITGRLLLVGLLFSRVGIAT